VTQREEEFSRLLGEGRRRDARGHVVHVALGCVFAVTVPLGPAANAIAFGALGVYALLRVWATWPAHWPVLKARVMWALAAMFAWQAMAIAWSPDPAQGMDDVNSNRFLLPLILALTPVAVSMDAVLVALGVASMMTTALQGMQRVVGEEFPLALWWHGERIAERFPGLLHPNSTAVFHMTVGLLALGIAVRGHLSARKRAAAVAVAVGAASGLVLTGSRGPWLAAIAGVAGLMLTFAVAGPMLRGGVGMGRGAKAAVGVMGALALALVFAARGQIAERIGAAVADVREMQTSGEMTSDTGTRVAQAEAALEIGKAHWVMGVGTGGYLTTVRAMAQQRAASGDGKRLPIHPHPHNAFLYAFACNGYPGVILMTWVWVEAGALSVRAMRAARERRSETLTSAAAAALPAATGALFFAFQLDCHNLSSAGTTMLAMLLLLALAAPVQAQAGSRAQS